VTVRDYFWRVMVIVGLVAMLLGAFDPLEGSLLILPGSLLIAAGAMVGKTSARKLICWAFVAVAVGVAALFALSAVGGVGGRSGHSMWWLLATLPYPVGWLIGLWGVLVAAGNGAHRALFGAASALSILALTALIVICLPLDVTHRMPHGGAWLIAAFVIVPHGLALVTALTGGALWIWKTRRTAGNHLR
jgi:hypothetical protein